MATENIRNWGLNDRVAIELADIRDHRGGTPFDMVSFYNNIYYFDVDERIDLFKKANHLLAPGGCSF